MNHPSPAYGVVPAAAGTKLGVSKIIIIIAGVIIGAFVVLGAIGIALGVGLGVGLTRHSDDFSSSALSAPTVTCNTTDQYCGCPSTTPTFSARIINGHTATTSSWPWMVYLTIGSRTCSGFLVTEQHVITAANCVYGVDKSTIIAYIGITQISDTSDVVIRNITNVTIPAGYSSSSNVNDIAILKLGQYVTLSSNIALCCIDANSSSPVVGENGVIAGWGETSLISGPSTSLRQAVVQVQSPSTCGLSSTSSSQFCAGYGTISTCPTDNGGPFMTSSNTSWTCSGVITGGSSTCYTHGTYTRVSSFFDDIINAIIQ
jgi:secreted trypsin-like serine protease